MMLKIIFKRQSASPSTLLAWATLRHDALASTIPFVGTTKAMTGVGHPLLGILCQARAMVKAFTPF